MSESIYNNLNCTNYEPLENKIEIFKEINSIPLKSITKKGYLKKSFRDHVNAGRIYDLNSAKVAIFVKKASQYFKKHNIKYHNDIFYYQKLGNQYYLSTAFQIIEKCLVHNNPSKYNLTKKELLADCYNNIMLTYGPVLGTKKWKEKSERVQGENNPGYQHGGKFSPFSENFVGYQNGNVDYDIEDVINKASKTKEENPERQPTRIEYWLAQGYDQYEAGKRLSEYQRKFSLDICIERYGEEEGYRIWKDRQDRWLESYYDKTEEELKEINRKKTLNRTKGPISKSEQEFISLLTENVEDLENITTQFPLSNENRFFIYDFKYKNKIIEFNGDYWHANPEKYSENFVNHLNKRVAKDIWEKDKSKQKLAKENGYEVLVIWESDFLKNKKETIKQCLNYLKT